ncbi:uncharacterized protein [Nicotiana sylvestris]|uniref:uncharacterized protein n=1 Tax=Nicotiana sylvestris TaxID=4096 RepID=UPI00388C7B96
MEDSNNSIKENSTEWVEVTHGHGTLVPKESASQLEQKLLKFQEEFYQIRNLASLSFSLTTPDVNTPNAQNPQNIPKPQNHPALHHHCNTCHASNNTPLLSPEPQNSTNDHFHTHHNTPIYMDTMPHSTQPISTTPESDDKDLLIRSLAEELKKLTRRIQGVEGRKGIRGVNYKDLCIQPNVELPEGYKPPKFEMFDGTGDPRVHLRIYCDKMFGVGKDERIRMKLFMRSLKGDALSWLSEVASSVVRLSFEISALTSVLYVNSISCPHLNWIKVFRKAFYLTLLHASDTLPFSNTKLVKLAYVAVV